MPANEIHPQDPRVFVCRVGHISKEAHGYIKYSCAKTITVDGVERNCRKKAIMLDTKFARGLFSHGWKAAQSTKSKHVCPPPSVIDFAMMMNDLVNDVATKA